MTTACAGPQTIVGETPTMVLQPRASMAAAATPGAAIPLGTATRQPFEPELVLVPGGEFWMGTREEDISTLIGHYGGGRDWYKGESPQHKVTLPDYYIAKTETTNAQYAAFVDATGRTPPSHWTSSKPPSGKENHPVVNVSWYDAVAYAQWLSGVTGKSYRLPSEAEWEKAARGTDKRNYPWGDQLATCEYAVIDSGNGGGCGKGDEAWPVGSMPKGASPYGALDMGGNVAEWTQSNFKDYPYNPDDGREDTSAGDDIERVVRGGSWNYGAVIARVSIRGRGAPDEYIDFVGFRLVSPISRLGPQ